MVASDDGSVRVYKPKSLQGNKESVLVTAWQAHNELSVQQNKIGINGKSRVR